MLINNIELLFENCESMWFEYPNFISIDMPDPTTKYYKSYGGVMRTKSIDGYMFVIPKDAVICKDKSISFCDTMELSRLDYNDITHITISSDNGGESICHSVFWDCVSDVENHNQKHIITKAGNHIFYQCGGHIDDKYIEYIKETIG